MGATRLYQPGNYSFALQSEMPRLIPLHWKKFEKFLFYIGCEFAGQNGAHRKYKRSDLIRPVIITLSKNGIIPIAHIKTNLNTIKMKTPDYLNILERL